MTEEERQKTILELEQQVFSSKPKIKRKNKCEVCGGKLENGECLDHPVYVRMHHDYLMKTRKNYE
tara:strand:- start:695 stop:889 length:195 start_codon:yes stop_codon:yes gene_type:complete